MIPDITLAGHTFNFFAFGENETTGLPLVIAELKKHKRVTEGGLRTVRDVLTRNTPKLANMEME